MKIILKIMLALAVSMFITACAVGGKIQVPEKYALGNKLEQVNEIYRTRILSWEEVDRQSLFIETSPSEYYLIVLMIPSPELPFRNRLSISHTGSMIRAGLDSIIISDGAHMRVTYPIDRIYRVKGSKQMRAIRDQLIGGKNTQTDNAVKNKNENDKLKGI